MTRFVNPCWRVGYAKVDVTPPLHTHYLSFHPRTTAFEGVHDRLYARAMAFSISARHAAAIVSVDGLGLSRTVLGDYRDPIREIRERVAEHCGIAPDHILIHFTHAHSTPQTTDLTPGWAGREQGHRLAWTERFVRQIGDAVQSAWDDREEVTLHVGLGAAPGIAWNRRILLRDGTLTIYPNRPADDQVVSEPKDDRVPVLFARGDVRRALLYGFCCHPTTVQVQPLVSADFPGVASDLVERELDLGAALCIQGACGDVGPVRRTSNFHDVQLYGRSLGGEVVRAAALLDAADAPPQPLRIAAAGERVELPRRSLPDFVAAEHEAAVSLAALEAASEADRPAALAAFRKASEACRLAGLGEGPVPVEVQVLRLGDLLIVAVEGELFCELGRRIMAASPAPLTMIAGYSNGYQGYLPTLAAWDQGGYEPSVGPWTRVAPGAGELLVERAIALCAAVWDSD